MFNGLFGVWSSNAHIYVLKSTYVGAAFVESARSSQVRSLGRSTAPSNIIKYVLATDIVAGMPGSTKPWNLICFPVDVDVSRSHEQLSST